MTTKVKKSAKPATKLAKKGKSGQVAKPAKAAVKATASKTKTAAKRASSPAAKVKKPAATAKKPAAKQDAGTRSAKSAANGKVVKSSRKRVRYMDHDKDYTPKYLADILKSVKTIAMVGASPDPTKFSYGVLRVLHETGYEMLPVNPKESGTEIRGLKVYESLHDIDRPVDMVQVFRSSDALLGVAHDAIDIGAKVLWGQIGVRDDEAARLAEAAGMKVVMNRCPKIELFRPFWKPRLGQEI